MKKIFHVLLLSMIVLFFFMPWLDGSSVNLPKASGATIAYWIYELSGKTRYLSSVRKLPNTFIFMLLYIYPILCVRAIVCLKYKNEYTSTILAYIVTVLITISALFFSFFVNPGCRKYCTGLCNYTLLIGLIGLLFSFIDIFVTEKRRIKNMHGVSFLK